MIALNTHTLFDIPIQQVIDNHITVKEAAEITGYNAQYLRRLLPRWEAGGHQDRPDLADQSGFPADLL